VETEPKQTDLRHSAGPVHFHPFSGISVGFGFAALTKDGATIWAENTGDIDRHDDDALNGADAERIASGDPEHDWQIVIDGPLAKYVYQRQGVARWVLIEKGDGFA
jgi:hypothetical protein